MSTVAVSRSSASELILRHGGTGECLRMQLLWNAILRIELGRGDGSFCDEPTFTVVSRECAGTLEYREGFGGIIVETRDFRLRGDAQAPDITACFGSLTLEHGAETVWSTGEDTALRSHPPEPDRLPPPAHAAPVWALHDRPRAIAPDWGCLPPPSGDDSGWRFEPAAVDVYLFLYRGALPELYRLMTHLTGPVPLPPLWSFGFWHSRYFPYTGQMVLDVIDRYRQEGFPLDVFVIDTDWRVGGSRGYDISPDHFPDLADTLQACAERGVHTLMNDHPESLGLAATDASLLRYRSANLLRLIDMGLTTWWFDRNWPDIIAGPVPGIETAVWGQKLYWDIVSNRDSIDRPVLLSMSASHPAAHRYPVWWTGDNESDWHALSRGVQDSVDEGLQLRPYTGQDIGGHLGYPSPEQYVRWMQWGAVSPTFRLHSGPANRLRYPWRFGNAALRASRDYVRLRYRLLPLLYTLARQAHESGIPLLRAMELGHPEAPAWTRGRQFMLGDDLLVAPIVAPAFTPTELDTPARFRQPLRRRVWFEPSWHQQQLSDDEEPQGAPEDIGNDHEIRIDPINWYEKLTAWRPGLLCGLGWPLRGGRGRLVRVSPAGQRPQIARHRPRSPCPAARRLRYR